MTVRRTPERPRLVHLTTTDMSLDWLLGPQLQAFAATGYDVIGMSAPGEHVDRLRAAGIGHVPLSSFTRSADPWSDVRSLRQLASALAEVRPDILHTHNPKPGIIGRVVGRLRRVPLVVNTQHGLYAQPGDPRTRRWPVYAAEAAAARFSHVELVQNEEDVTTLVETLRVPADRVRHLGNGIDLARFDPAAVDPAQRATVRADWGVEPGDFVCLAVCRLVREKGIVELLGAARRLRRASVPVRLVVVGPTEGDKHDAVEDSVVRRARADGVVLTGVRTDMPQCYAAADVFVTASWREGMPRAAMEAAAMGLPAVGTDIRGNRQVIADDVSGIVVPPRREASLAEAVERLAADTVLHTRLAGGARRRALDEFDQQRVIDRTLEAYRLLGG